jgi:hypothetical protein
MIGYIFCKKIGNIFKFRVDTLEHLHTNNTNFKICHDIYNLLIDRRNCISEFSKIKKGIPEQFIKFLKDETTIVPERRVTLNITY